MTVSSVVDVDALATVGLVILVATVLDITAAGTVSDVELPILVVSADSKTLVITAIMGGIELGKMKTAAKKGQFTITIYWKI